jgi:hypothetical protein
MEQDKSHLCSRCAVTGLNGYSREYVKSNHIRFGDLYRIIETSDCALCCSHKSIVGNAGTVGPRLRQRLQAHFWSISLSTRRGGCPCILFRDHRAWWAREAHIGPNKYDFLFPRPFHLTDANDDLIKSALFTRLWYYIHETSSAKMCLSITTRSARESGTHWG